MYAVHISAESSVPCIIVTFKANGAHVCTTTDRPRCWLRVECVCCRWRARTSSGPRGSRGCRGSTRRGRRFCTHGAGSRRERLNRLGSWYRRRARSRRRTASWSGLSRNCSAGIRLGGDVVVGLKQSAFVPVPSLPVLLLTVPGAILTLHTRFTDQLCCWCTAVRAFHHRSVSCHTLHRSAKIPKTPCLAFKKIQKK